MGIFHGAIFHENCQKSTKINENSFDLPRWLNRDFGHKSGHKDPKNGAKTAEIKKVLKPGRKEVLPDGARCARFFSKNWMVTTPRRPSRVNPFFINYDIIFSILLLVLHVNWNDCLFYVFVRIVSGGYRQVG